jgi:D,D-heptose 1,7-bisphosphate phosphatase
MAMNDMHDTTRAVFIDKDGTLVRNIPYNVDPARVELAPGAAHALQRLKARGFRLIVVSNQSGLALGRFDETALTIVEQRIQELLAPANVAIDGFYYCPHLPTAPVAKYARRCNCRKPRAGLMHRAAQEWDIDLPGSWLIGDILDDIEAGRRAGCRTVLIVNGNETEWRSAPARVPDWYARNLGQAARLILAAEAAEDRAPMAYELVRNRRFRGSSNGAMHATSNLARRA